MLNATVVDASGGGETLEIGPMRVRILEDGSHTENRIGTVEVNIPPGMPGPPQHFHKMHDETNFVTSGLVKFTLGDREIEARIGDYVVVPPGTPHTFGNASDKDSATFINTFTPAYYVGYFRELAASAAMGRLTPDAVTAIMAKYATVQV